jgi:branched-chain amino acid transport system ATP-binding protein
MPQMTVLENARLAVQARVSARGLLRTLRRDDASVSIARIALSRVGLAESADRIAGTLSHGQLRQLEIGVALAGQPKVLLLDEPLAGMGPEESETFATLLRELSRDHAVLLVEHDMDVVFAVAHRMTVMLDGRVLECGTPEAIRASAAVRDAYLGHSV